jgi:hypothetical protein
MLATLKRACVSDEVSQRLREGRLPENLLDPLLRALQVPT